MCRLRALMLKCRMWCYVLTPSFLSYATRMNWTIVKDFGDDVSHVIVAPRCPTCALQVNSDSPLLPGPALSFRSKDADLLLGGCCSEPRARAQWFPFGIFPRVMGYDDDAARCVLMRIQPQQRQLCPLSLMLLFRAAGL